MENFIEKSKQLYSDKYDYSLVEYIRQEEKEIYKEHVSNFQTKFI